MASSVGGQDEPNPALWLATRVGKMEARDNPLYFSESHIINPLLTKLVR